MSRKHFELIAATLRTANEAVETRASKALLQNLADDFASQLARENPRFDRARFLKACGL